MSLQLRQRDADLTRDMESLLSSSVYCAVHGSVPDDDFSLYGGNCTAKGDGDHYPANAELHTVEKAVQCGLSAPFLFPHTRIQSFSQDLDGAEYKL
jgi:hypothetical protein